jgi:hypothetical protein
MVRVNDEEPRLLVGAWQPKEHEMSDVQWDETEAERSRERSEFVVRQGDYWLKKRADEFAKLPAGTAVVINVANGEFVTGSSRLQAMDNYDQKFGADSTFGYVHEIGRPVLIGAFGSIAHG